MSDDSISDLLRKWYEDKKRLQDLEKRIDKYKEKIAREMNRKETDKLTGRDFSVTRRKNTRSYVTKDTLPAELWKQYATKCSYESYFLVKK